MAAISADINLNASDGRTDREKERVIYFPLSIAVHGPSAHLIQVTYQQ